MIESLKDKIKLAENEAAIDILLQQGKSYEFASARTRRTWTKIAEARKTELKVKVEVEVKPEPINEVDKKPQRKPRNDRGKPRKVNK